MTPEQDRELHEARTLAVATMTALDRFGLELPYEELKGLVANLDQANKLLARFQADQRSSDLTAAIAAIDQVRLFLVRQAN